MKKLLNKLLILVCSIFIFVNSATADPIFNGRYPCDPLGSNSTEDVLGNVVTFLSGTLNIKNSRARLNVLANFDLVGQGNSDRTIRGSSKIKSVQSSSSLSTTVLNLRMLEQVSGIVSPTRVGVVARKRGSRVNKVARIRMNTPYGRVNLICSKGRGAGSNPDPSDPDTVISGNFSGLYSGDESGTWSMSASNNTGSFTVNSPTLGVGTGPCTFSSSTQFTCNITHEFFGTSNISGNFPTSSTVTGSWNTSGGTSGSFSGNKN